MSDVITADFPRAGARIQERPDETIRGIGKSRVQLDFAPRAMKLLTELKEKTEAASYAEVIRNALKLYDGLITEAENGNGFLIQGKDGKVSPFRMFL